MKRWVGRIKKYWQENTLEVLVVFLILFLASILRFYKIAETLPFLGDEGRDALIVKRMIVDGDFTLIGPVTSVGNMYLGPLYYYMMLPALALFRLDPVGPAFLVAAIGVATVLLVYVFGKIWFGKRAGAIAAFLYAVSAMVVNWTRTSWNPNPMPFFSLLVVFSLYKVYVEKRYIWWLAVGFCFAAVLQMHYFGLVLLGVIAIIWGISFWENVKSKKPDKSFWVFSILSIGIWFLLMLPLFIFDIRHEFLNYKAVSLFFSERRPDFSIIRTLKNTQGRVHQLFGSLFTLSWIRNLTNFYFVGTVIGGVLGLVDKKTRKPAFLVFVWLLVGIFGLAAYYGDVYPHYLGYVFCAPFLLLGFFLAVVSRKIWGKVIVLLMVGYFLFFNLSNTPFLTPLGWNVRDIEALSRKIYQDIDTTKFNLVWISPVKDYRAMNYRFFLEKFGRKPLDVENYEEAEVLYVMVEGVDVDPVDYPIWEIQKFGKSRIDKIIKTEGGPTVYKLVKRKK